MGRVSIVIAMMVYYPFARAAERQRRRAATGSVVCRSLDDDVGPCVGCIAALVLSRAARSLTTAPLASARQQPAHLSAEDAARFTAGEFASRTGGKVPLASRRRPAAPWYAESAVASFPRRQFTVIAAESATRVTWIGTPQGAIRVTRATARSREYFAGRRWLPDDHVTGIGFDGTATWLETPKGFARIA